MKKKIIILISGGGTNLQSIIDTIGRGDLEAEIACVISDRPAYGLQRAANSNIPNVLIDRKIGKEKWAKEFLLISEKYKPELIVLAGFLYILDKVIIQKFPKRIINIHPALLPKYGGKGMYGMNVHKAVIAANDKESGCTVHFVDAGVDTGNIILQKKVKVLPNDTSKILQKRVLEQEYLALTEAIKKVLGTLK